MSGHTKAFFIVKVFSALLLVNTLRLSLIKRDSIDLLLKLGYVLSTIFFTSECTIDLNMPEMQYLSDHLTQEECHKLVAALHFQNFEVPQQFAAAERKLPEDVSCLELLLHWNSQVGEGRGGTHVEVCHRLNQVGRRDLAQWLSKTVFHELSKDLDDSVVFLVTDETTRGPATRVTEARKHTIEDEAPWLNLDSILALLLILAIVTCACGCLYIFCLCCARMRTEKKNAVYEKLTKEQLKTEQIKREKLKKRNPNSGSSDDETEKLISNRNPGTA